MNRIKLKIKTITPLIIKSGEGFSLVEFLFTEKKLYRFNIKKILKSPFSEAFKQAVDKELEKKDYFKTDFYYLKNFYQSHLEKLKDCLEEEIPLKGSFSLENINPLKIEKFIRYLDIEKDKEIPYIPGSSLKGSFLDAYFFKFRPSSYLRQFIGFSDFYFTDYENWIQKLIRYRPLNEKEGVKIYAELVQGEAVGELFFPKRYSATDTDILMKINELINSKDEYYRAKKRKFFDHYSHDFEEKIDVDKGLILPLGFGSGSFQKNRPGNTYFSFCQSQPFDPLGVIHLEKI